ncbi:glycosyltransferase family 2 protein [Nocardia terpenica]|uniref:Glycosyltransferase n=1 Tax=Nocardia terpenica TaxID=455432 RepID=A0A6G9Z2Y0_9NOCA|nr:glycosyltransferase family 2 protein [Nocardia terpenica]QIS19363.1 glycosyltransferase [Nocardia terpenica]
MTGPAFGVVIVTWNPTPGNVEHAISLARRGIQVCVVDNTPAPEPWYARATDAGITVLHNGNEGGLGGGFNRGIDLLAGRGAEVFFLFDQDSEPGDDYFDAMLATPRPSGSGPLLAGPVIYDRGTGIFLLGNEVVDADTIAAHAKNGPLETAFVISSGTMITRDAWQAMGPFDERYIIDYLDWDLCHRATRRGVRVVVNTGVVLRHSVGAFEIRSLLGRSVLAFHYPPFRRYYTARNCVHFTTRNARHRAELLRLNAHLVANVLSIGLFERDRTSKLLALAAGVVDGALGRLGHFTDTRPQLAALVARPR